MSDDLSLDLETVDRQRLAARVPADAWVSRQIGCSDLAPLLVAASVAPPPDRLGVADALARVEALLGPSERTWLTLGADRAHWACGMVTPDYKSGPQVDAGWAADKGRCVETPIGHVPEIVAYKAGVRTREATSWSAAEGNRLEAALLKKWGELEETQEQIARLVTQHEVLAAYRALAADFYPEAWGVAERSKRIAHPQFDGLVTYPDAWAWLWSGERAVINAKCHWQRATSVSAPYVIQMQGELAVTRSAIGFLPYGQGWTAKFGWRAPPEDRPIETFQIDPNPALGAALVAFARASLAWISEVNAEWTSRKKDTQ